jgi:hypothetical protein
MMDADDDGVINVDHVLKVIELLGMENTELPAKQIKQIITVLCKEEQLEVEDSIEDILVKKPTSHIEEVDEAFEKDLKALEEIANLEHDHPGVAAAAKKKEISNGGKTKLR